MASFIMQMIITLMLFVFVDAFAIDRWILDALQTAIKKEKVKVDVGIRNDNLMQDCRGNSMKTSFSDLDYALMGYHILKGNPLADGHDPGFTHPIFKANYSDDKQTDDCKFSIPKGYMVIPDISCQTSFTSDTIESSQQLKENMAISAKASGGGWGVSFSASTSYKETAESLQSDKVMVISRATCQYYFARIDEVNPPAFDDSFLKWVTKLNHKNSTDEEFLDFITYYGTHFMKTVVFGARYMYEHSMSKSTLQKMEVSPMTVEASLGYSGFGIQEGLSAENKTAASSLRQEVDTRIISVGSPPPENGDMVKWASSVKKNPVPYRYEMASIEELFDAQYLKLHKGIAGEKLKRRLKYIQMMYSNKIFQRASQRVCRVFNSAYHLTSKCCLHGKHTLIINAASKQQCIEVCLARKDCVGMTFANNTVKTACYIYSSESGHNYYNLRIAYANSFTLVFPYKLPVKSSSYLEEPIPALLIIQGIRLKLTSRAERFVILGLQTDTSSCI